jgi:ABC-type tungstate transport system substrate-binding protein
MNFVSRAVGAHLLISGNVVDDTRNITIKSTEEEEEEGFPTWAIILIAAGVATAAIIAAVLAIRR